MLLVDLIAPIVLYGSLNAGDILSTEYAMRHGGIERNPYGQTYRGRLAVNSINAAASIGVDLGLQHIASRYHGRTVGRVSNVVLWATRIGMTAVMGHRIVQNVRVANRLRHKNRHGT